MTKYLVCMDQGKDTPIKKRPADGTCLMDAISDMMCEMGYQESQGYQHEYSAAGHGYVIFDLRKKEVLLPEGTIADGKDYSGYYAVKYDKVVMARMWLEEVP